MGGFQQLILLFLHGLRIAEQIRLFQERKAFGFDLLGAARGLKPAEGAAGCPRLTEGLVLLAQTAAHIGPGDGCEKFLSWGETGTEGGGAIAVEQPGRIHNPSGLAEAWRGGVGFDPDVQAVAIRLADNGQAVMALVALQRIDRPAGPQVGGHATREPKAQANREGGKCAAPKQSWTPADNSCEHGLACNGQ